MAEIGGIVEELEAVFAVVPDVPCIFCFHGVRFRSSYKVLCWGKRNIVLFFVSVLWFCLAIPPLPELPPIRSRHAVHILPAAVRYINCLFASDDGGGGGSGGPFVHSQVISDAEMRLAGLARAETTKNTCFLLQHFVVARLAVGRSVGQSVGRRRRGRPSPPGFPHAAGQLYFRRFLQRVASLTKRKQGRSHGFPRAFIT